MLAAQLRTDLEKQLAHTVPAAFEFRSRVPLHTLSTGSATLDELTGGGLPRGAMTEFHGPASSGKTSSVYRAMAQVTCADEMCAVIDVGDAFSPVDAQSAGVVLSRVLWVRCTTSHQQKKPPRPV